MMHLRFLTQSDEIDQYFPHLIRLFQKVIHVGTHGEFQIEDLYRLTKQGHAVIGMIEQEGQVQLAFAFEFIMYPRWTAVNIMALAGRSLVQALAEFGSVFKAWCQEAGAKVIQASCRPSMARLLKRYGFTVAYQTMHCPL